MLNLRTVVFLVLALASAGGTAWLANSWLLNRQVVAEAPPVVPVEPAAPATEILVARQALATGSFVRPEHLMWKVWPQDSVVTGYLVKGQYNEKDLEGGVVRAPLHAGEPITRMRVIHPGDQGFLAAVLEPGKRAVSVPVDATRGVSGFIFPGDKVDVILTLKWSTSADDESAGGNATRYFGETLLRDVKVLGIDQAIDNAGTGAKLAKTATLEVTPKQAEKIAVALDLGDLSLSLRSIGREEADLNDLVRTSTGRITLRRGRYTDEADILSMMGEPNGIPLPGGNGPRLNLLRGSEASVVKF